MVLGKGKLEIKKKSITPALEKSIVAITKKISKLSKSEKEVAEMIKMELDENHGGPWIVVVGKKFGGLVTYIPDHFIYFYFVDRYYLMYSTRNMIPPEAHKSIYDIDH